MVSWSSGVSTPLIENSSAATGKLHLLDSMYLVPHRANSLPIELDIGGDMIKCGRAFLNTRRWLAVSH
eukprot:scaffold15273_cov107-Isochrysis_galbana.AAC.1